MLDNLGRTIDYARISITDRCNLRCVYCMPAEGVPKRPHADILPFDDIERVCRVFAGLGVVSLKVTGGEPLVRKGAPDLVARLAAIPGIARVTMTTNGILLPAYADSLRRAGLRGVNISLDAVRPGRYRELTRGGDLSQALRGVDSALAAGFDSVKVNCVPFRDGREEDLFEVAELARDRFLHVRFIEMMPIGRGADFQAVPGAVVRDALARRYGSLVPCAPPAGSGPAGYFSLPGFRGTVGFIDTLDHSACGRCNRVRLTPDGDLKTCLHADAGLSLKPALRDRDADALATTIRDAIAAKPPCHHFGETGGGEVETRPMSRIGG